MKPKRASQLLLGATRSQAKMHEFAVDYEINFRDDPAKLLILTIGLLGDYAARMCSGDSDEDDLKTLHANLRFSAYFFDAFLHSKLNEQLDPYLLLLGSASYYLCDLPGSSNVLASRLGENIAELELSSLEKLLVWLLQGNYSARYNNEGGGSYVDCISEISRWIEHYFKTGDGEDNLLGQTAILRKTAYGHGTPQELFFADIICAIVKKRIENSTWLNLPEYSRLSTDQWRSIIQKETFIQELWPAQHILGQHGVFQGKSATVQMPTSAGKTKAIEIIIRSAFISDRTSLSVIVAPFRALCHEIRNSLRHAFSGEAIYIDHISDVFQKDYSIERFLIEKQTLVVTPEKLLYMLRHTPELAEHIGLLIYDEGHQFDNGTRGITYELLLASLKTMVQGDTQTILISAVISNAESVGAWLNGDKNEVVSGANLTPTYRSIAFSSWQDVLGRLIFIDQDDPEKNYFVPRIIQQQQLRLKGREYAERVFPEKSKGTDVALYLGLKFINSGSVAIFSGLKKTVSKMCERVIYVFDRGVNLEKPIAFSDRVETMRLQFLYAKNLGPDSVATRSASLGVFAHHGSTPKGIRLAVEAAMAKDQIKFVICTSTLAQGINLPIRYLLITSVYQAGSRIMVRDFQNLIGRAGRSGIHTEGSILFADPDVFDERKNWQEANELLKPENSEPCASTILSTFEPLHNNARRRKLYIKMDALDFAQAYVEGSVKELLQAISSEHEEKGFTYKALENQVAWKMNIISTIESYLLAHWDDKEAGLQEDDVRELALETLAYYLSDSEQQDQIIELFLLLAKNIRDKIEDPIRRKAFGKTLFGLQDVIAIENWVTEHLDDLNACNSEEELLSLSWPILEKTISNKLFRACNQPEILQNIAAEWIAGVPYYALFDILIESGAKRIAGSQLWKFQLDDLVEICEVAFSYDATLALNAVAEMIQLAATPNAGSTIDMIGTLQKRMKYGLPSPLSVSLYEAGFADRVVSMDLESDIAGTFPDRDSVKNALRWNSRDVLEKLSQYPGYFSEVYQNLTT
jgi:POLQ-like helicase